MLLKVSDLQREDCFQHSKGQGDISFHLRRHGNSDQAPTAYHSEM